MLSGGSFTSLPITLGVEWTQLVRVTWPVPATATKAVGDTVEVRVRSERRRVKVSLVTVTADGRERLVHLGRSLPDGSRAPHKRQACHDPTGRIVEPAWRAG